MSEKKAYRMIDGLQDATFTLANLKKDISTMTHAAKSMGMNLPMIARAEEVYGDAVRSGLGEMDYTGIIRHIEKTRRCGFAGVAPGTSRTGRLSCSRIHAQ